MIFPRVILLTLCISTFSLTMRAQRGRCGTDASQLKNFILNQYHKKSPNTSGKILSPATSDTLIIPVVVHVVYHTSEQNISDEQIKSQIDAINEDFQGVNASTNEIPDVWKSLLKDTKIRFCLACSTPGTTPKNSTGITRDNTSKTVFNFNDDSIKFKPLGADAWPSGDYLNIWVCNLQSPLLGYALLPGGDPLLDGVVIHYRAFGRIGDLSSKYNYGQTLTHELGHYFNLVHIWGDDGVIDPCSQDDYVNDTPLQGGANYCCPRYPQYDECQTSGDGVMFMNYMDYSDDKFMQFFTPGQIERMDTAISDYRSSLFLSQGCVQPFSTAYDLSLEEIVSPLSKPANRCFKPIIRVKNNGSQAVSGYTIAYNILSGIIKKITVSATLLSGKDTVITLPEISGKDKVNILEVRILEQDSNNVNNYASRSYHAGKEITIGCDDIDPFIYPNPVLGSSFCAKSNFTISQELKIRVINLLGEKVSEQTVKSNPGDAFSINMGSSGPGFYFVQMIGEESGSRSSKVLYLPAQSGNGEDIPCNY